MVNYKLYYFPARGRAEVCRLIFAVAGVKYEDIRIPGTEWSKHKAEMPLGFMPVLEVDGEKLSQSHAIARYLAREYDLYGKNNLEGCFIDMITDTLSDIGQKYPFGEKDEAKKAELKKKFFETTAKDGMKTIESLFVKRNGGNGFMLGEKLSVADLSFFSTCDFLLPMNSDLLECVPKLKALYQRVGEVPKVKAWVEKRPKSDF